ncbi:MULTISPECIES: translation initiation factor IF-3 [Paenibacillus]|uniref:translation initiation factor IF-3 n=1 Tax=Paenibacillus TaxID=44249 RepID=UPI0007BEF928|nr:MULTISPECIES: translation initiation factor IF-3 [Paenibacillus]MCZ1268016.1 translation initiation factor IF-3 [Paenibacillus tundrae]OAX49297.1 Translation initiation factor IF-3 [Paenibacillus sp. AD87]SEA35649.1 translation initiation factor IF-3 [Paenibacillus sp. 276b]SHN54666.1 translation initiation factor IF-3 [Paenibacillus sp. ov031]SLJ96166.1 translation initiation factor IF-3 [Paenibacillus sp. RU5A]
MIKNEKIKATEVQLTGLNGEDLGIMSTRDALALAKQHKVDLICMSLMTSPPPCKLMGAGAARQEKQQEKKKAVKSPDKRKVKEIRLNLQMEDHDRETKQSQAERILTKGDSVKLVIQVHGAKEGTAGKEWAEQLCKSLAEYGSKTTGIQVSGKQVVVQLDPIG